MRKNRMMRLASVLLVLTLLTTSMISGTFAKYTTSGTSSDSARVAKWGVEVSATSDLFSTTYATDDTNVKTTITNSVVAANGSDKLVAPGTSGSLGSISISGTPEVAVKVSYSATLTLTGWEYSYQDGEQTKTATYFPIVITVGSFNYKMGSTAATPAENATSGDYVYTSLADLKSGVENAIAGYSANYAANTPLAGQEEDTKNNKTKIDPASAPSVSWSWAYSDNGYQTDAADTALGNLTSAPTINLVITTTVEQID